MCRLFLSNYLTAPFILFLSLNNSNVRYCGAKGGGMFKTIDKGLNRESTAFEKNN